VLLFCAFGGTIGCTDLGWAWVRIDEGFTLRTTYGRAICKRGKIQG
jgi:hypothetical protein